MKPYRKKPVVIYAVQLTAEAFAALSSFCREHDLYGSIVFMRDPITGAPSHAEIPTLEGVMRANLGDWIIRGVKGELYPCKPDVFEATYEAVE